MTTSTIWKWSFCRWVLGALILFLAYTACSTPIGYHSIPIHLERDERLGLPKPPEQIAGLIDLPDGYHKRARVYLGTLVSVVMFATGSFRNCVDEELLKVLEEKQRKGELGKQPVISPRRKCNPTDVDGAANGYMTTYREVVEIDVTFKQPGGN